MAGRLHRLGLLLVVALTAGPVFARAAEPAPPLVPAAICQSGDHRVALSGPALEQVARSAESLLAVRGGDAQRGDEALQMLSVGGETSGVANAPALAAYCSAAGESARLARSGSQYQAQTYLLTAIHYAEQAHEPALEAMAAYRLALATVGGPVIADTRGGGAPVRQHATAQAPSPIVPPASDSCAALSQPGFLELTSRQVVQTALACANFRAHNAGDAELSGLTALRLSRMLTATAQTQPATATATASRDGARQAALSGLADAAQVSDPTVRIELMGRLVEAAIETGAAADPSLDHAVAQIQAADAGPQGDAYAAALAGRLAFLRGDAVMAREQLRRAVFRESQRAQPLREADWLLWLAQAEPERRVELVTEAYRALEAVRPLLPIVDPLTEESTFTLRMQPVFQQAVEVQLADHDPNGEVVRIAGAQEVVEAYRQAEIQSALGADCVPPREPVKPAQLRAGEILLYPILLGDRIELIYAQGADASGAPQYKRLPANPTANREVVARLVADLVASTSAEPNDAWRAPARRLYELLIKPIEGDLKADGTLVIVPDGPLRSLPFAALLDGEGKFLIQRTGISIAPALSYSQPGVDRTHRPLAVVAASLEKAVSLPAGYFPKLDGTQGEAQVAVSVGGSGDAGSRLIANFHKADLQTALADGRVDVLHVATHAAFNGRSDRSFIVANDEAIPMADLRAMITANRARGDELDLLVLSACETAVGDDQASMGLAGAAVQAGAQSALASLWEVNDLGTVELMKAFYAGYRAGLSKAEALRQAQLKLIAQGGDAAQPNIWAAFTLLGGWR